MKENPVVIAGANEKVKPQPKSKAKIILSIIGVIISSLYLLNITFGIAEFLPDNLPFVGNIDEVFVSGVFYSCLRYLGLDLMPFNKKNKE